ncbi:MAG TPA: MlaD family protein [Baekduia sp.]|nr:MlaD family protein [Baekduia sp.]
MRSLRALDRRSALGLATLVLGTVLLVAGLSGALRGLFENPDTREVQAVFADAQQVRDGSRVRLDGIPAGTVKEVELDDATGRATVTMDIERDAGPLFADARAVLRWRTVLGGSFYVDLERGTASRGELQGPIGVQRTDRQVELDDVTQIVDGRARQGLQTLPGELAKAFQDPADLRGVLETTAKISPDAASGLAALRGMVPERDLRALVTNTSRTVRALDTPRDELRTVVAGAAATLGTTAARGAQLRATLQRAPGALRTTEATMARLVTSLDKVDPLLADLRDPAGDVAPTLERLQPVVTEGDRVLRAAGPLLDDLRPAAASLRGASQRGLPLLRALEPSLERTDKVLLPMLAEKDPQTTKSTAVMIGGTFAALASGAGGQMDVNGHFIRFPATAGNSSLYSLPCQTYLANPDKKELVACQTLQQAMKTYLTYDPLSATPGTEPAAARRKPR